MLLAVKLWALAHLLANGTLADVLLFGGFLAWAVADRISVKRRPPPRRTRCRRRRRGRCNDAIALIGGLVVYARVRLLGAPLDHRRLAAAADRATPAPRMPCRRRSRCRPGLAFEVAPFRLSGTVYGDAAEPPPLALAALGDAGRSGAVQGAPKASSSPSSRATRSSLPARAMRSRRRAGALEVGAALGIVIGTHAPARVAEADALGHVAGYVIVARLQRCRTLATSGRRSASRRATRRASDRRRGRRARDESPIPTRSAIRVFVDGALAHDRRAPPSTFAGGAAARRRQRVHDAACRATSC